MTGVNKRGPRKADRIFGGLALLICFTMTGVNERGFQSANWKSCSRADIRGVLSDQFWIAALGKLEVLWWKDGLLSKSLSVVWGLGTCGA
jgi:hypothetical protein